MATRANWAEALAPGLKQFIDDAYKQKEPDYPKVFRVLPSTRAYEEFVNSTGVSYLLRRTEKAAAQLEDPIQGYKTRLTPEIFTMGISVTKEMVDDDQYNIYNDKGMKLAKAAQRTDNRVPFEALRGAFSTAKTSYGDNLPLCSTVHTRADGGSTQSNASATGIPLLEQNIETARLAIQSVKDDKGQLISIGSNGYMLIVPPALRANALRFTRSTLRPSTANNDINVYQIEGDYEVFITDWISANVAAADGDTAGSDTAWFLMAKGDHGLVMVEREPFNTDDEYVVATRTLEIYANRRFAYGWIDWRGLYGSKGDNAAYSS